MRGIMLVLHSVLTYKLILPVAFQGNAACEGIRESYPSNNRIQQSASVPCTSENKAARTPDRTFSLEA
jgi:hypothetical protein